MKKKLTTLSLTGLILALTACGGVEKDAAYETVEDLREAVIKSGGSCPGETAQQSEGESEALLRCSDTLTVRWFKDEEARKIGNLGFAIGIIGEGSILTGPNWIVQGDTTELADIQKSLGGELSVK